MNSWGDLETNKIKLEIKNVIYYIAQISVGLVRNLSRSFLVPIIVSSESKKFIYLFCSIWTALYNSGTIEINFSLSCGRRFLLNKVRH